MKIVINGASLNAREGMTILDAALENGIEIPTLCAWKDFNKEASCRMCVVEVKGAPRLMPACATKVTEGMEILTESEEVIASRRQTLDLICTNHRMECEYCSRYTDCELHKLVSKLGLDDRKYMTPYHESNEDISSPYFVRDYSKCVLCRRCVLACEKQKVAAIGTLGRGANIRIGSILPMPESGCIGCGQCIAACPTGALRVKNDGQKVWNALRVSGKKVIAVISPEAADNIGEYLHERDNSQGRLAALLKQLGFAKVYPLKNIFDEEIQGATEETLISAVCPAALQYCENYYPELERFFSKALSPIGAAANTCRRQAAKELDVPLSEVIVVTVTPCVATKTLGCDEETLVITPTELVGIINQACVSKFTMLNVWKNLQPEAYDYLDVAEKTDEANCTQVFGMNEVVNALKRIQAGDLTGHIKVYACPGGCSGGGGMLHGNK